MDMEGASDVSKYVEVATNTTDSLSPGYEFKRHDSIKRGECKTFMKLKT